MHGFFFGERHHHVSWLPLFVISENSNYGDVTCFFACSREGGALSGESIRQVAPNSWIFVFFVLSFQL